MSNKEWGGIVLNPYCSNKCVFCGVQRRRTNLEVKQQGIRVLRNLTDLRKQGIVSIDISGSDPIDYDKIIPLIKYIKKMGFKFVQLSTHGKRLSDESFLNELILSGIDKLRIPLYGSNTGVHDSVTKTPGSFDAALKGIKGLLEKSQDIQIQISCLIVQQNKDNLTALIDLVKGLKIKDFYFSIPCVANKDYSYYIPLKDLGPYVKKAYEYALKINYKIRFMEIPYCVFGQFDESIDNTCSPPNLGKYCQPPKKTRSSIKNLPSYRVKRKIKMCSNCKCLNFCDGFFVNDIDKFGIGKLKPVSQK